ncbi:hypothetical protein OHW69_08080 [Acinetobacter baumannii]|nr:hypothetical protein [Acinetobacter baumannii]
MDNYKEYLDPKDGYVLVKQSVNMPVHPHWIGVPDGAEIAIKFNVDNSGHGVCFYKNNGKLCFSQKNPIWEESEWTQTELLDEDFGNGNVDLTHKVLWIRKTQDPALIGGAESELVEQAKKFITLDHLNRFEAAEAHLEGHPVQFMLANGDFIDITSDTTLGIFEKDGGYSFRLKPQTIKLELELPKAFEPKVGEEYFYLNSGRESGFAKKLHDGKKLDYMTTQFGAWRTEDEIKKVVEQLRKIRGTNS